MISLSEKPYLHSLAASRYKLYNPNDDPEFDPDLVSTNDLRVEGCGLEEQLGD
jgi:hypothetical protein